MGYPSFYTDSEPIELYDPLSDFLGASEEGKVSLGYLDCVKLAGHSCPTVAGAYLMARAGLQSLYPNALPRRSEILVELSGAENEGVVGVIGNVIGYIAGAGGIGGFKGIAGKFSRNERLHYGVAFDGDVRLSRIDTGDGVILRYDPSAVPGHPDMKLLMQKTLRGDATPEETRQFQTLWQSRTQAILTAKNTAPFLTITKDKPS
jgi:hypothetical protein